MHSTQEKGGQRRGRVGFRVRTKLSLRASPRASHRGVGGFRTPLPNDDWKDKAGSESRMTTQCMLLCSSEKFLLCWVNLFLRLRLRLLRPENIFGSLGTEKVTSKSTSNIQEGDGKILNPNSVTGRRV